MKAKALKTLALLAAIAMVVQVGSAKDTAQVTAFKKVLARVELLEVSPTAARLVSQADPKNKSAVAADVVEAAVQLYPSATLAIVNAISHANPSVANVVAAKAASMQPEQAVWSARIAAKAAPSQALAITLAVADEVPEQSESVANGVGLTVPAAKDQIRKMAPKINLIGKRVPKRKVVPTMETASTTEGDSTTEGAGASVGSFQSGIHTAVTLQPLLFVNPGSRNYSGTGR